MENKSINTAIDKLSESRNDYPLQDSNTKLVYEHLENYLNSRILKITTTIKNQYPELLEYLNEMPETIPSESTPEITLNNLKTYAESLNSILKKYKLENS